MHREEQIHFAAPASALEKLLSAAEICCIPAIFFPALWLVAPHVQTNSTGSFYVGGLALLLFYAAYVSPILIHQDRSSALGIGAARTFFIRTDNLGPALRQYGSVLSAGGLLIIGAALLQRPQLFAELNWQAFFLKLSFYLFSATAQGLLLATCLLRLKTLFPPNLAPTMDGNPQVPRNRGRVCLLYALLFSACHLPNMPMMVITLVYGFIAAWIFYTTANLAVAACCHAVLGTLLHRVYELNMAIGPFYYDREMHVFRTVFPPIGRLIGGLF